MLYVVKLTIPANTPREKAIEQKVKIKERYVERILIYFPPGHHCLTRVAIFYGLHQLVPDKDGEWAMGDNITLDVKCIFPAPEIPFSLTIKGYNLDTKYDHTVYVYIFTTNEIADLILLRLEEAIRELVERLRYFFGV